MSEQTPEQFAQSIRNTVIARVEMMRADLKTILDSGNNPQIGKLGHMVFMEISGPLNAGERFASVQPETLASEVYLLLGAIRLAFDS